MQEPRTWREFLATLIRDIKEKQRIASEMGVDPITLTRWATRESSPRPRALLNRLVAALPQYREQLSILIRAEFPEALEDEDPAAFFIDSIVKEVPSVLYARILEAHATIAENIRPWTIVNLVMQQLIRQLDPEQVGIAVVLAQCVPPFDMTQKVQALREQYFEKSPPLQSVRQRLYFLGAESLAGYVVAMCRPVVIQDIEDQANPLVIHHVKDMQSAAAYPLQQAGRVAGSLMIVSTQKQFFLQARQALIQNYSHLLSLAFRESEFHALEDIELQIMPPEAEQDVYLATFNQRINALLKESEREGRPLMRSEAEMQIIAGFLRSRREEGRGED